MTYIIKHNLLEYYLKDVTVPLNGSSWTWDCSEAYLFNSEDSLKRCAIELMMINTPHTTSMYKIIWDAIILYWTIINNDTDEELTLIDLFDEFELLKIYDEMKK